MTFDPWNLTAFVLMAIATYACRAGGYWLFRQISPSPTLRAIMAYIPGALFVSFVVPAIIKGGLQPLVGAVATAAVMLATRSLPLSITVGLAAAWAVWLFR